jgi:hypothetical protein
MENTCVSCLSPSGIDNSCDCVVITTSAKSVVIRLAGRNRFVSTAILTISELFWSWFEVQEVLRMWKTEFYKFRDIWLCNFESNCFLKMSTCAFAGCQAKKAIKTKGRASLWMLGHLFGEKPSRLQLCEAHNLCGKCAQPTSWDDSLCVYCDPDNK